ncbi:MAG: phosphoribosylformylglycinamidine synthase subunit PurL [Anaerolineae bacterium]
MGNLQTYRINVFSRTAPITSRWVAMAHQLNIHSLTGCFDARIFFVQGDLSTNDLHRLSRELLTDPVTEDYVIGKYDRDHVNHTIDITLQAGVTDPVADNLIRAADNFQIKLTNAATGQHFRLYGDLSSDDLRQLATKVFSNPVVQRHTIDEAIRAPFITPEASDGLVETIIIREKDDAQLLTISQERRLALDLAEMRAIQRWYTEEARDPTDIELEMIAQTWSEHCVHKTFKAKIHFENVDGTVETIDGLIQQYLKAATDQLDKPWVYSAFVDNAGIIRFDDQFDLAFKAETHNHPSALEPFGGANTGVGGVVRDVLGVSAKPIANTDILCFGPQNLQGTDLPEGVLHPRRIQAGVVHGIEDYGNKMGIPTVNGAILYDQGYTANPLVFCGCVGILPHDSHRTEPQAGDYIVVLGGHTGRDGLRGATFSSMEMDTQTSEIASISVQIGHPIQEKQVQEVILQARDANLYNAITDCGAGGLSSAVGEMGELLGAMVQLQAIPLKYPGLRPWEIWLSEAQERMVMAVAPENWEQLQAIARGQDVEISQIGTFGNEGRIALYDGERLVGELGNDLLHECLPRRELVARWQAPDTTSSTPLTEKPDVKTTILGLLSHPNIRSKEDVVRRYDHEVQGGTVIKPFVGIEQHVGGDASVLVPIETQNNKDDRVRGFALSIGVCPQYTALDPYAMGWAAIDEAFRNLVAVGADPDQVALLDNFSWGNPNLPDRLGSLVLAARACHDAALAYQAPFISGKDSLNNEYADADGTRHAIPGTLVISALGIVPDARLSVTMDLKQADNLLYIVGGGTYEEFGGSHYYMLHGIDGGIVPQPRKNPLAIMRTIHQAIQAGYVQACHDVSEGGTAVALAEMCMAGRLGAEMFDMRFDGVSDLQTKILFSESTGRFLVEIKPENQHAFEHLLGNTPYDRLARVTEEPQLVIAPYGEDGETAMLALEELEQAYRGHIADSLSSSEPYPTSPSQTRTTRTTAQHSAPRVLILHANGTNRDHDASLACELAGGQPEIVHINQLLAGERHLLDYHMLVVPGGFSYGDDLGAGQLWAQALRYQLRDELARFAQDGRPVLGICNGFQVLLKSGLLPDANFASGDDRDVTLTYNENGQFECRWVHLHANPNSTSLFTEGLDTLIHCPVAHGEGRVMTRNQDATQRLWANGQVALTYVDANGEAVGYPLNPNGSVTGIAGLNNREGNVLGLMPHPENHIFPWQHPQYQRGIGGQSGLVLFKNGIRHA